MTSTTEREVPLDRAAVAEMAGYSGPGTVTTMLYRSRKRREREQEQGLPYSPTFPEPDGCIGRDGFYWYPSTIAGWLAVRIEKGQGRAPVEAQAENGPGACPICGKVTKSVSAHRTRRPMCSYDPGVRDRAQDGGAG